MPEDNDDKKCAKVFDDGRPCGGYHVKDSLFCFKHSERAAEFEERRIAAINRREELAEELLTGYHKLQTSQDVVDFIEKIINGLVSGLLTDPAMIQKISMLIPYLSSNIKAASTVSRDGPKTFTARMIETKSVEFVFQTDEEMDEFLQLGDPELQIKMLESLSARDRTQAGIPKLTAEDLEVDGFASLEAMPEEPETVFIPEVLEEPKVWRSHKWQRSFEPIDQYNPSIVRTIHTCKMCEKVSPRAVVHEDCPEYED